MKSIAQADRITRVPTGKTVAPPHLSFFTKVGTSGSVVRFPSAQKSLGKKVTRHVKKKKATRYGIGRENDPIRSHHAHPPLSPPPFLIFILGSWRMAVRVLVTARLEATLEAYRTSGTVYPRIVTVHRRCFFCLPFSCSFLFSSLCLFVGLGLVPCERGPHCRRINENGKIGQFGSARPWHRLISRRAYSTTRTGFQIQKPRHPHRGRGSDRGASCQPFFFCLHKTCQPEE